MDHLNPQGREGGDPHWGSRRPVLGSSAGSNRTSTFDESTGVLRHHLPRRSSSDEHTKPQQRHGYVKGRGRASLTSTQKCGRGSGVVSIEGSDDDSSTPSRSSGFGFPHQQGGTDSSLEGSNGGDSPPVFAASLPPNASPAANCSPLLPHNTVVPSSTQRSRRVQPPLPLVPPSREVLRSPSSTEYESPSEDDMGPGAEVPAPQGSRVEHRRGGDTTSSRPPEVASQGKRAGEAAELGEAANSDSCREHYNLPETDQQSPQNVAADHHPGEQAAHDWEPSSSTGTGSSSEDNSSSSTLTTSESDGEDGDSVALVHSKLSEQSEAPSSRVRQGHTGFHSKTIPQECDTIFALPIRDVRSSLVTTIDVDVAVMQRMRRQRQHELYLNSAFSAIEFCAEAALPSLSPSASSLQRHLEYRTNSIYTRHMDALVEHYLSGPKYRIALAQFRKRLPTTEQRLRTEVARVRYQRATERVPKYSGGSAGIMPGSEGGGRRCPTDELDTGKGCVGAAAREESLWGGGVGTEVATHHSRLPDGSCGVSRPVSSMNKYRLERTDVELLAGDMARRARLLDDTLPWRPINFNETGIQLEPLDLSPADASAMDVPGRGAGDPSVAIGGSVNLMIEVLILTEMDVPFTSAIPLVNYTNLFLLLASLFVQGEVLITKLIRLFRSVRSWEGSVDDVQRAVYLENRILQCLLVYCRVHESDLTVMCLQRLASFAASEGFPSLMEALDDAQGKEQWPCQEGAQSPARRQAAAWAAAAMTGAPCGSTTGASTPVVPNPPRHFKRYGFQNPNRSVFPTGGLNAPQRRGAQSESSSPPRTAPRPPPLQLEVAQTMLEFTLYLQRTMGIYYRAVEVPLWSTSPLSSDMAGPRRIFVDAAAQRPSLGCTYGSPGTAVAGDRYLDHGSLGGREGAHLWPVSSLPQFTSPLMHSPNRMSPTGTYPPGTSPIPSGRVVYGGTGFDGGTGVTGDRNPGLGRVDGGGSREASVQLSSLGGTVPHNALDALLGQKPLAVVDIDAGHLSQQICLLSFSLFAAVHIRELLNNAWTDVSMQLSVATKLTELMEFSAHLQRWTAAVIVTPSTWIDCQRVLRYFLEVCRTLYELQNYEMTSALLDGLRHPAVEQLARIHEEIRGQNLLAPAERRELATLRDLMDPYAAFSPSSLNSVAARTAGDMEAPMIPRLSPILDVLLHSQEGKGSTVRIRDSDGQAVVHWSKLTGLGKMLILWMRCQYTPYSFPVDLGIQEYVWSAAYHQWTDAALLRAARRTKR